MNISGRWTIRSFTKWTRLMSANGAEDHVGTYFGMRKISVGKLPGTDFPYVTLNNKPIYLKITLDQSYNPDRLLHVSERRFHAR